MTANPLLASSGPGGGGGARRQRAGGTLPAVPVASSASCAPYTAAVMVCHGPSSLSVMHAPRIAFLRSPESRSRFAAVMAQVLDHDGVGKCPVMGSSQPEKQWETCIGSSTGGATAFQARRRGGGGWRGRMHSVSSCSDLRRPASSTSRKGQST